MHPIVLTEISEEAAALQAWQEAEIACMAQNAPRQPPDPAALFSPGHLAQRQGATVFLPASEGLVGQFYGSERETGQAVIANQRWLALLFALKGYPALLDDPAPRP